ncbi:hypothetical protein [Mycolicibacterium chitae]|uniref:hypothetical protein n=1 Tax=Mycolicibacterium chitae TaxID=1792 RepID=UPI0014770D7E|nr:hypothetical protein [Mycolicibacterium chitae]
MCELSKDSVARSSAARATGPMSSAWPSAPAAMISDTAASIALRSESSGHSSA